ncbi:hypothetical protein O9K51_07084 [Purpureocillium lavendulum]|uniref:Uncharacterized protein n=1 Tax=Purpureocillium lavendulum TaxID=1247861 RepID=A0AB34FR28_9HYPO|nr:hypothetical protein O9K51_07084 [Purpureocillium lavendulum]
MELVGDPAVLGGADAPIMAALSSARRTGPSGGSDSGIGSGGDIDISASERALYDCRRRAKQPTGGDWCLV